MNKAVFFDRDGVIIKKIAGEAPTKISDLELIPEAIPVISELKNKGYKIIVVSNQPNVAQGIITEEVNNGLVKKFEKLLKENNINVDGVYYCFHHERGVVKKYIRICNCKKPKPGMLLKAMRDHKIDPKESYMVGDRALDIKAGSLAGVKTILIDPENSEKFYLLEYKAKPDFVIKKLTNVLNIIKDS